MSDNIERAAAQPPNRKAGSSVGPRVSEVAPPVSGKEARRVADVLLERILSGRYAPGLKLPSETEIATELGCGRSTVREALSQLASVGVVRSRRGSGAVVLDYRREGTLALLAPWITQGKMDQPLGVIVAELLHMRTHLACESARLAALYATPASLEPVRHLAEHARTLENDPIAHSLNDLEINRALVASSCVWPAVWLGQSIWQAMAELARRFPMLTLVPPGYGQHMTELLARIEARDAEGAMDLVAEHLACVDALVATRLGPLVHLPRTTAPAGRMRVVADASRRARPTSPALAPSAAASSSISSPSSSSSASSSSSSSSHRARRSPP